MNKLNNKMDSTEGQADKLKVKISNLPDYRAEKEYILKKQETRRTPNQQIPI